MTISTMHCTLSLLIIFWLYYKIIVCWFIYIIFWDIGFIMWRPGVKIFSKRPHYCNNPKLIISCLKIGFAVQGQQKQKKQGQKILKGIQHEPMQEINFG